MAKFSSFLDSGFITDPLGFHSSAGSGLSAVTGQKQTFEYQKQLNNLTMAREDNAYQRAVADARKAGLSPLAVSGGADASSMSSASIDNTGALSFGANLVGTALDYKLKKGVNDAQIDYINAQKDYLDAKRAWEEKNGFRSDNPLNAITGFLREWLEGKFPSSDSPVPPDSSGPKTHGSEIVDTLNSVGSNAPGLRDVLAHSDKFKPIGFVRSSSAYWTLGELAKIHNAYGPDVYASPPDKATYYRIALEDGADRANAWLKRQYRYKEKWIRSGYGSAGGSARSW